MLSSFYSGLFQRVAVMVAASFLLHMGFGCVCIATLPTVTQSGTYCGGDERPVTGGGTEEGNVLKLVNKRTTACHRAVSLCDGDGAEEKTRALEAMAGGVTK
uniref:Uncharacterized protein n=1 Tax=Anopheles farauti TaxID=69004 RepID=A0A182QKK6_9DIPT